MARLKKNKKRITTVSRFHSYDRVGINDQSLNNALVVGDAESKDVSFIHEGTFTNHLASALAGSGDTKQTKNPITQALTLEGTGGFSVAFTSTLSSSVKASSQKLLDVINIKFTQAGAKDRHIQLSLREYMEFHDIKDIKEARKKFKRDADVIYDASIQFTDSTIKQSKNMAYTAFRLLSAKGSIDNSVIHMNLSPEYATLLSHYPLMAYPMSLIRINDSWNPYSYLLGRKIREYMRINRISKKCYLSVGYLLKAAGFPDPELVGGHYSERIKRPFERDMDALDFIKWRYVEKNHKPLAGAAKEHRDAISYARFVNLFVEIEDTKIAAFEPHEEILELDGNPPPELEYMA